MSSSPRDVTPEEQHGGRSSRRGLLGLAGAALVGVLGGALGRSDDARAADGGAVLIGGDNVGGGASTRLTTTATINDGAALAVAGANAQSGIKGVGRDIGVYGEAPIGVFGEGAVGGVFSGSDAAISLTPAATAGPPTGVAVKGDLMVDSAGVLHLCIAGGNPGTWIPVSHGGARMLSSPQRPYSSTNPGGGVFLGGETRRIQIVGPTAGVPASAVGIVGNLTVHSTRGAGYLTAFPAGTSKPFTSNLNWFGDSQLVANAVTVRLGAGGAIDIYANTTMGSGVPAAHVIVDVAGYLL